MERPKFRSFSASRSHRQKGQKISVTSLLGVEQRSSENGSTGNVDLPVPSKSAKKENKTEEEAVEAISKEMFSNDNFFESNNDAWVENPEPVGQGQWKTFNDTTWDKQVSKSYNRPYSKRSKSVPRKSRNDESYYSMEKVHQLAVASQFRHESHHDVQRSPFREIENELMQDPGRELRARKYLPERLNEQDKVKMVDAMLALSRVADRQERKIKSLRGRMSGYKDQLDEKDDIIKELIEEREELRNIVIETRVQCKIYKNRAEDMQGEMMDIQQSMASLQVERDDYAARYSILASKLERDPTLDDDILTNNDTLNDTITNEPSTQRGASSIGSSTFDVEKEALAHQVQTLKQQLNNKVDEQVRLEYELAMQKDALMSQRRDIDIDSTDVDLAPHNVTFKKARDRVDSDVSED